MQDVDLPRNSHLLPTTKVPYTKADRKFSIQLTVFNGREAAKACLCEYVWTVAQRLDALGIRSNADIEAFWKLAKSQNRVEKDQTIIGNADCTKQFAFLIEGVACLSTFNDTGDRRIGIFYNCGDLLGLHSILFPKTTGLSIVQALTTCSFCEIDRDDMEQAVQERPALGRALWRAAIVEASISRQRVAIAGRRAKQRVAHILCEQLVRLGTYNGVVPLSQIALADAAGLSVAHMERVLRKLRELGVIALNRQIEIVNAKGLQELALFDGAYLHTGDSLSKWDVELPNSAASLPRQPASPASFIFQSRRQGRHQFISRALALGFSLDAIDELLAMESSDDTCGRVYDVAQRTLGAVRKLNRRSFTTLESLAAACPRHGGPAECPILTTLCNEGEREPESEVEVAGPAIVTAVTRSAPLLLHVYSTFSVGGPQVRFAALANKLGKRFRHAVLAMDGRHEACALLDPALDIRLPMLNIMKGDTLGNLRCFRTALREVAPDLLVTSNWGSIEWAVAAIGTRIPHVHMEDGFGPDEQFHQRRRRVLMRRLFLRRATVVVPSLLLWRIAADCWRLPLKNLRLLRNGVDLTRFAQVRPRTGKQPLVIGTVAALRPEKNITRLIRAFALVSASIPVRLVIVGDGPERARLEAFAAAEGVGEKVEFVGYVADPAPLYQKFDIFALSSVTEQMPLSVLEAMASGLAVAATDVGDVAEMLDAANRPYVVAHDDTALAAAMLALATQGELRAVLGAANRSRAEAEFDEAYMIAAWGDLFAGLARSR